MAPDSLRPADRPPGADVRTPLGDSLAHRTGWLLLCAAAVTPLIVVPGVFFPFVTTRTVVFRVLVELGLLCVLVLLSTHEHRLELRRDFALWALAAFVGSALVSALLGPAPFRSLFGDYERMWGAWGWFHFLAYYLALRVLLRRRGWVVFFRTVVAVGGFAAAFALVAFYSELLPRLFGGPRPDGLIGNSAYHAAYLFLVIGLALLARRVEPTRTWQAIGVAASIMAAYVIVLTETRAMILGAAVGLAWAAGWAAVLRPPRAPRVRLALGAAIALGAVVLIYAWLSDALIFRRFREPGTDDSLALRLDAWAAAWRGFVERPVLGWGPDNFGLVFSRFMDAGVYSYTQGGLFVDKTHNAFLEVLSTQGILGLAAFLAFWLIPFARLRRALHAGLIDLREALLASSFLLAFLVYLGFWFEDLSSMLLALALVAYLQERTAGGPLLVFGARRRLDRARITVLATALVAIGLALYAHGVNVLLAAHQLHDAVSERADHAVEERWDSFRGALRLSVPQRTHALHALTDYLAGFRDESPAIRSDPYQRAEFQRALGFASDALAAELARDPENDRLYATAAELLLTTYYFTGDARHQQAAVRSIEEAIRRAPARIPYRDVLAALHYVGGDLPAAEAAVTDAIALNPDAGEPYYMLALIERARDRPDAAGTAMARALARGFRASGTLVESLGDTLLARGRPAVAAELYLAALRAARTDALAPAADPAFLALVLASADHLPIVRRLPIALAEAGEVAAARRAAAALAAIETEDAEHARAFLRETADGSYRREAGVFSLSDTTARASDP